MCCCVLACTCSFFVLFVSVCAEPTVKLLLVWLVKYLSKCSFSLWPTEKLTHIIIMSRDTVNVISEAYVLVHKLNDLANLWQQCDSNDDGNGKLNNINIKKLDFEWCCSLPMEWKFHSWKMMASLASVLLSIRSERLKNPSHFIVVSILMRLKLFYDNRLIIFT